MGNNVVVPDRQSFETMEQVRLDATVQTILQQWNVNFKDNVTSVADLPATGNTVDDFRMTLDTGWVYRWDGNTWVGLTIDTFSSFLSSQLVLTGQQLQAILIVGNYIYVAWQIIGAQWWINLSQWLAKYNMLTQSWETRWATNNVVSYLVYDWIDNIYMWWSFTTIDGNPFNRLAAYSISGDTFSDMWSGISLVPTAMYYFNGNVYVSANTSTFWWVAATNIARWNVASSTWFALNTGMNASADNMIDYNWLIYCSWAMSLAWWVVVDKLAIYDPIWDTWAALWSAITWFWTGGMTIVNDFLYVSGNISSVWWIPVFNIARYDLIWWARDPTFTPVFSWWWSLNTDWVNLIVTGNFTIFDWCPRQNFVLYNTITDTLVDTKTTSPISGSSFGRSLVSGDYIYIVTNIQLFQWQPVAWLIRYNKVTNKRS